ncbi:transposase [Siccirubricoccus deserti]|uniref:Transposase n=1 Tax=Siccirubricoccus deserti TaxID=2013562 RepID=A0A9X0UKM5_9PROT|nr:transposase [Siccirubricoccus deserti]
MPRKRHTAEQIIGLLRQAEVEFAQGRTVGEICRRLEVSEATFYRWRSEYGGLKVDQARRLKDLERENARLKRAVAELTLDKQILKEAVRWSPDFGQVGKLGSPVRRTDPDDGQADAVFGGFQGEGCFGSAAG